MSIVHNANKRQLTTPAGTARFPHLNTPDTKFDENGVYKVDLVMDADSAEAKELMELLDGYVDAAMTEQQEELTKAKFNKAERYYPYFMEEDDEGEQTGNVVFRFKAAASFKDQKTGKTNWRTITMFDAKGGKALQNPPVVRMGSVIKVAAKVGNSWYNATNKAIGVTCYIQAVQILSLSEGGGTADNFGFGEEDYDGVGETEAEQSGFSDEEDGDSSDGPEEGEGDF